MCLWMFVFVCFAFLAEFGKRRRVASAPRHRIHSCDPPALAQSLSPLSPLSPLRWDSSTRQPRARAWMCPPCIQACLAWAINTALLSAHSRPRLMQGDCSSECNGVRISLHPRARHYVATAFFRQLGALGAPGHSPLPSRPNPHWSARPDPPTSFPDQTPRHALHSLSSSPCLVDGAVASVFVQVTEPLPASMGAG